MVSGAFPASQVTGLANLAASCPKGQVVSGYDSSFNPICADPQSTVLAARQFDQTHSSPIRAIDS